MTFAIVAFLIGGLSINANAQDVKVKKSKAKVENQDEKQKKAEKQAAAEAEKKAAMDAEKKAAKKATKDQANKVVNYDQMLNDYESNVDNYIKMYEASLKSGSDNSNYATYLKKAQDLEAKLTKAKEQLSRSQVDRFVKIQTKLAKALTKK